MAKLSTLSLALFTLTTLVAASALPEVLPGPNLPRLEPLDLTTSNQESHPIFPPPPPPPPQHHNTLTPRIPTTLTTRADLNTCDAVQLNRANILAGIDFLIALGTTPCVVGQQSVVFVTKGDVAITGYNGLMGGEAAAPCRDVGEAVRWIVDHCVLGASSFGGTTTAVGRKEVVIRVRRA